MPDIDIIIKAQDNASGKIKDVNRELGHLDGHSKGLPGPLGTLSTALGVGLKVAAVAAGAAIVALGAGLKSAITAAADMEQSVADISAVFGKSAPPVEDLNKAIHDLALDPLLKVSATDAADAINMLAKNGITWDEISGGMAKSTVLLANATNDDFALAADVATNAMVQFNKDATDMEDVINGIVGVTQASQFDINDYALAIGQAGGVAGAVGVDFDDFNAMLAATSSSFNSGSDAGTSFKVFLQQLVPDTNKSADAMRALGLFSGLTGTEFNKLSADIVDTQQDIAALDPTSKNYGEQLSKLNIKLSEQRAELNKGGSAFFDANGNMKSGEEIAGALSTAFSGLSDAERISAASTIFGTDAMRTALALADAGADTVGEFKKAIGDTSAEDAAATRMDTLKGSWEIFKGVVESLSIQLGTAFLPVIRDVVDWLTKMATEHGPAVIAWVTGFTTSISTFIEKLQAGNDPLTAFKEAFVDFIPPAVMTAIETVVGGIQSMITLIGEILGPYVTWKDVLIALGIAFTAAAIPAIVAFIAAVAPVAALLAALIAGVALVRNAWENDWGGVKTATLEALDSIKNRFAPLVETIKTFGGDALKEIKAFVTGNETEFTALGKIWDETKKTFGGLFTDLKTTVATAGAPVLEWFDTKFPKASDALKKAFEDVSTKLSELWDVITKAFNTGSTEVGKVLEKLQKWWKEHGDEVQKIVDNFLKLTIAVISGAITIMTNMLKLFFQLITGDWKGAWETIKDTAGIFTDLVKTIWETFVDNLKELWKLGLGDILTNAKTKWDDIKDTIHDKIGLILSNVTEKWEKIKDTIIDRVGDILTNAREKWEQIKVAIADKVNPILEDMKTKWEAIKKVIGDRTEDILTNSKTKWEAIKKAIDDKVSPILDNAKDKWEQIKRAIADKTENILTNTREKWELIKTAINGKVDDINTKVKTRWDEIRENTKTTWETISTNTSTKWTEISTNTSTKWTEISTIIGTQLGIMLTDVTKKIGEIFTAMTSPFAGIYETFKGFGSGAAQGLIDGIGSLIQTAKDKAAELASLAAAAVGIELEAQSPSKVFYRHGQNAAQGFVNGMDSKLQLARTKAAELAGMASNAASQMVTHPGATPSVGDAGGVYSAYGNWLPNRLKASDWIVKTLEDQSKVLQNIATTARLSFKDYVLKTFEDGTRFYERIGAVYNNSAQPGWLGPAVTQGIIGPIKGMITNAAGEISDVADGAQRVLQHLFDAGEIMAAQTKSFKIMDSIEPQVDALVRYLVANAKATGQTLVEDGTYVQRTFYTATTSLTSQAADSMKGMVVNAAGEITDVADGAQRVLQHLYDAGEIMAAKTKSFKIFDAIEPAVDALVQSLLANAKAMGKVLAEDGTYVPANRIDLSKQSAGVWTGVGQDPAVSARIQAEINARNAAAPLITTVSAGVAKVLDHWRKAGELMGASSKSFNILDSIEAAVDAAARQAVGLAALPTQITSINQGVQRVFEHWQKFGELLEAAEFNISSNILNAVDAQVKLSFPGFKASIQSALGINSPSKYFDWVGEMSAKGFSNGFNRALEIKPVSSGASVNNSRTTSNQIVVQVQTTGNVVQDIRNQVELYALTFGAT